MRCIDFQELISAELDGELDPREAAALEAHLTNCTACSQVREEYRVNQLLLHAMTPLEAPAESWSRILQAVEAARDEDTTEDCTIVPLVPRAPAKVHALPVPRRRRWMTALKVAACVGIAFVGFLYWLGYTDPDTVDMPSQAPRVSSTVPVRSLVRGHAWLQVDNPMADRAAWHYYMAVDSDDERHAHPGRHEYQSAEGEVR